MDSDLKFVVGSVVTIFSSILGSALAVFLTLKNDRNKDTQKNLADRRAICLAISTELKIILEFYNDEFGDSFRESVKSEFRKVYYPFPHKLFTIYEANASSIGRIHDDRVRDSIVIAYSNLKNLFDSFEVYNSLLKEWASLIHEINNTDHLSEESTHKYLYTRIRDQEETLTKYALGLRERDQLCSDVVKNSITELNKY